MWCHRSSFVVAIVVVLLLLVAVDSGTARPIGELSDSDLRQVIEAGQLSEAIYAPTPPSLIGEWQLLPNQIDSLNGLRARAYERDLPNDKKEIAVVYAGTRNAQDILTDIIQGLLPGGLADLERLLDPVYRYFVNAKFSEAKEFAELFVTLKDHDRNITIYVTGHSMGGTIAQYVCSILGIKCIVFNSAAMNSIIATIPPSTRPVSTRQILQVCSQDDPICKYTPKLPGAAQYGVTYTLQRPAGFPQDAQSAFTGQPMGTIATNHSMELLFASLVAHAQTRGIDVPVATSGHRNPRAALPAAHPGARASDPSQSDCKHLASSSTTPCPSPSLLPGCWWCQPQQSPLPVVAEDTPLDEGAAVGRKTQCGASGDVPCPSVPPMPIIPANGVVAGFDEKVGRSGVFSRTAPALIDRPDSNVLSWTPAR